MANRDLLPKRREFNNSSLEINQNETDLFRGRSGATKRLQELSLRRIVTHENILIVCDFCQNHNSNKVNMGPGESYQYHQKVIPLKQISYIKKSINLAAYLRVLFESFSYGHMCKCCWEFDADNQPYMRGDVFKRICGLDSSAVDKIDHMGIGCVSDRLYQRIDQIDEEMNKLRR